jgi:hypothetical protein
LNLARSLVLISQSSDHHISLLRSMVDVLSIHYYVVLLHNGDSILIGVSLLLARHLGGSIVLLSLNDVTSLHLRILDFNLRVVEDVVVVIYILDDFDGLLLTLFLWL